MHNEKSTLEYIVCVRWYIHPWKSNFLMEDEHEDIKHAKMKVNIGQKINGRVRDLFFLWTIWAIDMNESKIFSGTDTNIWVTIGSDEDQLMNILKTKLSRESGGKV